MAYHTFLKIALALATSVASANGVCSIHSHHLHDHTCEHEHCHDEHCHHEGCTDPHCDHDHEGFTHSEGEGARNSSGSQRNPYIWLSGSSLIQSVNNTYSTWVYLQDGSEIASLQYDIFYDNSVFEITYVYSYYENSIFDYNITSDSIRISQVFSSSIDYNYGYPLMYFDFRLAEGVSDDIKNSSIKLVVNEAYDRNLDEMEINNATWDYSIDIVESIIYADSWAWFSNGEDQNGKYFSYWVGWSDNEKRAASGSIEFVYETDKISITDVAKGDYFSYNSLIDYSVLSNGHLKVSFIDNYPRVSNYLFKIYYEKLDFVSYQTSISATVLEMYTSDFIPFRTYTSSSTLVLNSNVKPTISSNYSYNEDYLQYWNTIDIGDGFEFGAADFEIRFDTKYLTFVSITPLVDFSYFIVNDSKVNQGVLKVSVLSTTNILGPASLFRVDYSLPDNIPTYTSCLLGVEVKNVTDCYSNPIEFTNNLYPNSYYGIPPTYHEWSEWEIIEEATCERDGRRKRTCMLCGRGYEESYTAHEGTLISHHEPTCESSSWDEYCCTKCGRYYAVYYGTSLGGHIKGNLISHHDPTCTENGYDIYECIRCGQQYWTNWTNPLPHEWSEWELESPLTCSQDEISVRKCSVCGTEQRMVSEYYRNRITPKNISVSKNEYDAYRMLDQDTGSYWYGDSYLKDEQFVELELANLTEISELRIYFGGAYAPIEILISKDGETYKKIYARDWYYDWGYETSIQVNDACKYIKIFKPSITDSPNDYYSFSISSILVFTSKTKNAESRHSFLEEVIEPTCTSQGYTLHTCELCGYSYKDNYIDPIEHDYVLKETIAPTCTEEGYSIYECSSCGLTKEDNYIAAKGHDFGDWVTTKEAYEEVNGEEERQCKDCGYTETRVIRASGHNYASQVVEPTCTEDGYTLYTCSNCGDEYKDDFVPALGHDFGEWSVTTAPTCTKNGESSRKCSRCQHTETRIEFATGHDYVDTVVDPTCTEDGYTLHKCSKCGDEYKDNYVDPTDHHYIIVEHKDPTCTEDGYDVYQCVNDPTHTYTTVLNRKGHNFKTRIVNPSCEEEGYTEYICQTCGYSVKDHYTSKLGHDYKIVDQKDPTCEEEGYISYVCQHNPNHTYTESVPATGHDFGDWYVTLEATEETNGEIRRDCKNCDYYETHVIPATGHSYVPEVIAPTCTARGYTIYTCEHCGNSYIDDYVPATGHSFGEWEVYQAATCDKVGEMRRTCSSCGYYESKIIPATGHNYVAETVLPTCSSEGYTTYTCSECGDSYISDIIPPLAHDYEVVVTDPTCTEKGYTTYTCKVCGYSYRTSYVDELGHTFGDWEVYKEPTEKENGEYRRYCSTCGAYESRVIQAFGHHYVAVITAPTCTSEGYTTYTCSHCGDSYISDIVSPLPHDYEIVVTDPTCTEKGYTTYTCKVCGYSYRTSYVDELGHSFGDWEVYKEPGETENGEYRRYCSTCGAYESKVIPATGHNYVTETVLPTCTSNGYTIYTCTDCGDSYIDDYVDPLPHDYEIVVTDPTCTEKGFTTYTCKVCGYAYNTNYVDELGHSFGDWEVYKEPGETENGEYRRYCSTCGAYESKVIPATGHNFVAVVTAPTCTEKGYTTYTCTYCGDSYLDNFVNPLGHDYYRVVTAPTCTAAGYTTYTCKTCGYSYVDDYVESLGHNYVLIERVDPTCTAKGYEVYACSHDPSHTYTIVLEETGHHFGEWVTDVEPTCQQVGSKSRTCEDCGYVETASVGLSDHNYVTSILTPTCTQSGYTVHTCTVCGQSYIDDFTSALGHNYVASVVNPTCTQSGYTVHVCTVCGASYITDIVQPSDHTFGEWVIVTEATYESEGMMKRTCTVCGYEEYLVIDRLDASAEFIQVVNSISSYDDLATQYEKINRALELYSTIENKQLVQEYYQKLLKIIEDYNALVRALNEAQANAEDLLGGGR